MKTYRFLSIVLTLVLLATPSRQQAFGDKSRIATEARRHSGDALACTHYVDQNHADASNSNAGTDENWPWATVEHAASTATAGDVVCIKDGVYYEIVDVANSGTSGSYITFQAFADHAPVLDGTGNAGWFGVFSIYGKDYIRLDGLEIRNNSTGWGILIEHDGGAAATNIELLNLEVHHTGGEAIQVRGNAHDILIQDCRVHDGDTYSGIDIYQWNGGRPHHVTVTGCTAYNYPSFAGIASEQADNLTIENNTVYDSELGIDIGSGDDNVIKNNTVYGCYTGIALSSNEDSEVYGNTVYNIYDEALYAYYWSAHGEAHARNKWYNNTVYDAGFAVYESDQKGSSGGEGPTSDHVYYNNLFYNVGTHGSYRAPFHFEGTTELKFYNNTIYMNPDHDALELLDGAVNADIRNNIFGVSGSGTPVTVGGSSTGATIDYNCYHNRSGGSTGPGAHSVTGDPLFVSVAGSDFHLQQDSPCIDAGVDLSTHHTTDMEGTARPQGAGWDVGAYEFVQSLDLSGTPANGAIHLNWSVNATLPLSTTWRIDYVSDTLPSLVLTETNSLSATRAYTLTGLVNYAWYTVTLHAMVDSTSFLSDTVRVMVTDVFVYLPVVVREE